MIRRVILAVAALLSIAWGVRADNYFSPGTVWKLSNWSAGDTWPTKVYLEGDTVIGGKNAYKMWEVHTDEEVQIPQHILNIASEGDRVYYWDERDSGQWLLMFDFGWKIGDRLSVGVPFLTDNWGLTYLEYYQDYVSEATNNSFMVIREYKDANFSELNYYWDEEHEDDFPIEKRAKWINGIGSEAGPYQNGFFFADGGGPNLRSVYRDGVKIYDKDGIAGVKSLKFGLSDWKVTRDSEIITISNLKGKDRIAVYDVRGNIVMSGTANSDRISLPVSGKGIYIVSVNGTHKKIVL